MTRQYLDRIKLHIKVMTVVATFLMLLSGLQVNAKNICIAIDPGHGGTNLGCELGALYEKDINLITAMAMKAELETYAGVDVYMTRTSDEELSLAERVMRSKAANPDFFMSLHYNASSSRRVYGSEVEIPSRGENYSKAYAMGDIITSQLAEYGFYNRGIKTRINGQGGEYYGILKYGQECNIPSMIVEHCHMDSLVDFPLRNSVDKLQFLGKLDATAVAKYYGLTKKDGSVSYAGFTKKNIPVTTTVHADDTSEPENLAVRFLGKTGGNINLEITAKDSQSRILYYDYSFDGVNYSELKRWDNAGDKKTVSIPAGGPAVIVRVYNQYDKCKTGTPVICN